MGKMARVPFDFAALEPSLGFQKPQRVLINHIWPHSLFGFITANSSVIRKTVLHVKSKT